MGHSDGWLRPKSSASRYDKMCHCFLLLYFCLIIAALVLNRSIKVNIVDVIGNENKNIFVTLGKEIIADTILSSFISLVSVVQTIRIWKFANSDLNRAIDVDF